MLRLRTLALAATLFCAATTGAQIKFTCSNLSVKGSGKPGTDLTLSLKRSASQSVAFLVLGLKEGETNLPFGPLGTLKLGLNLPFLPVYMGPTDVWGSATRVFKIHPKSPAFQVKVQAFSWGVSLLPLPSTGFCTSNVVDVKGGQK